jgi:hypothetical protein
MSRWLDRLKNGKHPETYATEPTKPGYVGFVACPSGVFSETGALLTAPTESKATLQSVVEVHDPRLRRRLEANGLSADDAMALAVKLHGRKAGLDDRHVCFECQHFARGLCRNAIRAGLTVRLQLMPVPEFFDQQLQRCPGFALADF